MNTFLIFLWIYLAMMATSFWESSVEGRNAWAKEKYGWRVKIGKYVVLTRYHFYLFYVMWPLLLTLPFITCGWDKRLFGILLSAYSSGMILEDFMWFVVNPVVKLSEFNPNFADYYPWLKMGKFKIPLFYLSGILIAFFSWFFIWR